jgi:hypothetical protein
LTCVFFCCSVNSVWGLDLCPEFFPARPATMSENASSSCWRGFTSQPQALGRAPCPLHRYALAGQSSRCLSTRGIARAQRPSHSELEPLRAVLPADPGDQRASPTSGKQRTTPWHLTPSSFPFGSRGRQTSPPLPPVGSLGHPQLTPACLPCQGVHMSILLLPAVKQRDEEKFARRAVRGPSPDVRVFGTANPRFIEGSHVAAPQALRPSRGVVKTVLVMRRVLVERGWSGRLSARWYLSACLGFSAFLCLSPMGPPWSLREDSHLGASADLPGML